MNCVIAAKYYIGRECTVDELQFADDGDGVYISVWNIDGIKKPSIKELNDYYEAHKTEIENDLEKERLIKEEQNKMQREIAIERLITAGKLNPDGSLKNEQR